LPSRDRLRIAYAGLAAGTYNATITITGTGAANSPQVIPVSLTLSANTASGATLTWTANTEPDLAGYKIYSGTQSGVYGAPVTVGKVTSHVLTNLPKGTTYFFTVTACDTAGNESPHSPEVSKSTFKCPLLSNAPTVTVGAVDTKLLHLTPSPRQLYNLCL
jgi:fibronectin type 3 domain-containing protein